MFIKHKFFKLFERTADTQTSNRSSLKTSKLLLCQKELGSLALDSLHVEEKSELIEHLSQQYKLQTPQNQESISNWLNGRYSKIISYISTYEENPKSRVHLAYEFFLWGVSGVVAQDIEFAYKLVTPVVTQEIISDTKTYDFARLTQGISLYYFFKYKGKSVLYYEKAVERLNESLNSQSEYIRQRTLFFLASLNCDAAEYDRALEYFVQAVAYDNVPNNQYTLLFSIITQTKFDGIFTNIASIFTKENIKNDSFWRLIKESIQSLTIESEIEKIYKTELIEESTSLKNENEIVLFLENVNLYMDSKRCANLYNNKALTKLGNASVLFTMGVQQEKVHNLQRALLMYCESNDLYFTDDKLHAMSNILLENYAKEIRGIFERAEYSFKSKSVHQFCHDKKIGKSAWSDFVHKGFVNGNFDEEREVLEYIESRTKNQELQKLLWTRLAFLYYKGDAGILIGDFKEPNYKKAYEYFLKVSSNPLVKKYLEHPNLAIYKDLEDVNENEYYIFLQNQDSSELIIVFACAFSYFHYAQLRAFYKQNRTNVLFLNNPTLNWYSDDEYERIKKTVQRVVLPNFQAKNVVTYFGSMGGYAALKVGLEYGFKAIVFNPQINMDIWKKYRPNQRVRLDEVKELVNLEDIDSSLYEKTPMYYMCSSSIEDVEAFSIFINKISLCKNGLFIIEKVSQNVHAGIFSAAYRNREQEAILAISELLKGVQIAKTYPKSLIPDNKQEKFWHYVEQSLNLRLIIEIDKGKLYSVVVENNFLESMKLDIINSL